MSDIKRPSKIVLIVLDTLRADHLGCYGYRRNTSPNIDLFSREVILFKHAFSACSYTMPSHVSLFTGKSPSKHSAGFSNGSPVRPLDTDLFISEILSDIGYETAGFVSSIVLSRKNGGGIMPGFRVYNDTMTAAELNRQDVLIRAGKETNEAVFQWLRESCHKAFFLFINYFDIHGPYFNPEPYESLFVGDILYKTPVHLDRVVPDDHAVGGIPAYQVLRPKRDENNKLVDFEKDVNYYIAQYDGGIRYVDDCVKDLLNEIKSLGIYDDTLIILTSDHGESMGENNVWFFHGLTVTPDLIHTPLLIKPHKEWDIEPRVIQIPVSLVDIFPTIGELVGFDYTDVGIDGKSLLGFMNRKKDEILETREIFSEIEGQIACIDKDRIRIEPKKVDKENLVFFFVDELCNKEYMYSTRTFQEVSPMKFTGERYIPDLEIPEISYEHWHRYLYATPFVKDKVILDIACGEGYGSHLLSQYAKRVVGIDISPEVIEYASINYVKDNLEFKTGSAGSIPIEGKEVFDVIISFETIEHITEDEQKAFMREVKRLLKPDGLFIVSTPNKLIYSDIPNHKNEFHIKEFYINEFKEFLGGYFKNIKLMGQKVYPVSYIWDTDSKENRLAEYRIDYSMKGFCPSEDPKSVLFVIAVCSDGEIDTINTSIMVDLSERLLKDKDQFIKDRDVYIANLEGVVKDKNAYIQFIQSGHGWRLLTKYFKLRDALLPPETFRRKAIKFILTLNTLSFKDDISLAYYKTRDSIFPRGTHRREVMKSIRYGIKKAFSKKYSKRYRNDEKPDRLVPEAKENDIQTFTRTDVVSSVGDFKQAVEDFDGDFFRNLRIAFVGQPEYFSFMYEALDRDYNMKEFVLKWGGNLDYYRNLVDFNPHITFFLRPELYPSELLEELKGINVALSSEPMPKYINGRLRSSHDMRLRFDSLKTIKGKRYDYFFHYDKTSLRFLEENGIKVDGEFFFPVDTRIYRPYDCKKIWDWGFFGRSTQHRENYLGVVKRDFNGLHVAHGVYGQEFVRLMNSCTIGINMHVDENVQLEPRVQMMMACKVLVLSEPLSHNELFQPGKHFVEFTHPEELWQKLGYYLKHDDERERMTLSAFTLVRERLSSHLIFQQLIERILNEHKSRFESAVFSRQREEIALNGSINIQTDINPANKKSETYRDVLKKSVNKPPFDKLKQVKNRSTKPLIGFFLPNQSLSGGIMVVCQHANRLIKKGYNVILVDNNPGSHFKLMDWFPNLLAEVVPVNKKKNIDIAFATHWSTAYTVRDLTIPRKLYFIQSDETRFNPPGSKDIELARTTYSFDFEFVVIARWLQKWLQNNFGKSSHYVPNGVDRTIFYPCEPLEPKNKKLRVLLEGPIDVPFKGMKEAFEVVDGMDCEVWCISSLGRPKPHWKCDRFFKSIPHEQMKQIYSSCDVLLKMSKVEGFFMPPLEMMACGGTVITGKVTGYDEYIVDGYNGLVAEQGDVRAAKEKLGQLIEDRNLLISLKKGGLETATEWTWEFSNDRLEEVINGDIASFNKNI